METAVEPLEDNRVRIRVEVDAHDVDHAFEHAIADLARDVRVPGFRKGKAPAAVIRQRVGEEAVADEALRSHVNGWWRRACSATGIDGIDQPQIDFDDPPVQGQPFTFTGTVAVPPKAELPEQLELAAVRPAAEVTDEMIDEEIERIRTAGAGFEAIDAAVESGHQVLVDMRGSVNGKAIKDEQATFFGRWSAPRRCSTSTSRRRAPACCRTSTTSSHGRWRASTPSPSCAPTSAPPARRRRSARPTAPSGATCSRTSASRPR